MKIKSILILQKLKWISFLIYLFCYQDLKEINANKTYSSNVKHILQKLNISDVEELLNGTRRIMNGVASGINRPYMVYLKLPFNNPKYNNYRHWLCGGVIIHEEYILTSAACIEDAKHFYVVSGTYRHNVDDDRSNNPCIKNGAKKAVWKCVPKNFVFEGHENDNLRWMQNDIAIVRVENEFDFTRRIRGCDYIPKPIRYNNESNRYENPGNTGVIAGWGSTEKYSDWINKRSEATNQELLETKVVVITKQKCKSRWGPRYHNIIDNFMICTKDSVPDMREPCKDQYVECKNLMDYFDEEEEARRGMLQNEPIVHSSHHNESRRVAHEGSGGFCENDHGGPLIYGDGANAIVIGIISACLVKEKTNKCYGPYLYTSVYKNRVLINCAIYRNPKGDCEKVFRSGYTFEEEEISWIGHPDGPAKNSNLISRKTQEDLQIVSNENGVKTNSTSI